MAIGTRIKALRTQKNLSQGDIEAKTGLLRCYISRVENGHTVPSLETLERFASAFDMPLYSLFWTEQDLAGAGTNGGVARPEELESAKTSPETRFLERLKDLSPRLSDNDRDVLLTLAKKLASH